MPVRQNKPIPASVPPVDIDAIAAALNQCSNELDHLERGGQIANPPPEPIDDLVVVDMYTPKEQIPHARRQQAAQTVAMQGPAEEGARTRQNQLIQALKISPGNKKLEPFSEPVGVGGEEGFNRGNIPQPKVINREPEKPHPTAKTADELNPMLEAFEAAVYSQGPEKKEQAFEVNEPEKTDLSQDKFESRLMPKSNAYEIEREKQIQTKNDGSGMSLDELHSYYASQKEEVSKDELAAREAFLSSENKSNTNAGVGESGFLSGLGGSGDAQHPGLNHSLENQNSGFSTAGGFLSGLDAGGAEQQGAFSSREIAIGNSSNEPASGGNFLDGLNAFNQPQNPPVQTHSYGLPPLQQVPQSPHQQSNDPFNSSGSLSPEAKAYRDSVLYGGAPPENSHEPQQYNGRVQPPVPPQHPVHHQAGNSYNQPQQMPAPGLGADGPSFLGKPSLQHTRDEATQPNPAQREQASNKRKKKEKVSPVDWGRRKAIQAYFGVRPMWTILTALIGIGTVSSQGRYDPIREWIVLTPSWILLSGLCLFAASVLWRYFSRRKPKEETLDDWTAEDLVNLERRAFDAMQLQNRYLLLEPIVMSGFPDIDNIDDEYVNGLYGKDHILRYTPRALTVMCFTRGEILTYEGAVDLTTGQVVYEYSREFFYSDVATIGMVKSKVRRKFRILNLIVPWRWLIVERVIRMMSGRPTDRSSANVREVFQISLKDGSRVQLVLRDAAVMRENTFEELAVSADEKVLQAITDFVVVQKTDQLAGYR